jgi:outer membrane cobalamin receptor
MQREVHVATQKTGPMKRVLILLAATASPLPVYAQEAAIAAPATSETNPPSATAPTLTATDAQSSPATVVAGADDFSDDEEAIVVRGQRQRGSVVGDIPPENTLDSRDIRATGATSISELLDAVAAQTGSARGRSSGRPVLLLNGQRISGFRELRDLPPEAISRMEILPEEVALKYGYSADQRVVNIVLRQRFRSTTAEVRGEAATDGGYQSGQLEATRLTIRDNKRTSVNLNVSGNTPLYESERAIALAPGVLVDERDSRTLNGANQAVRLTGTHNRPIGEAVSLTVTGEAGISHGRSRFGLADFDATDVLTRNSTTTTLGVGSVVNAQKGQWRLSASGNADYSRTASESDRSLVTALSDDKSRSTRTSLAVDGTANGPLFTLPAGKASTTLKVGLSRVELDSESRRSDLFTPSNPKRTQGDASINLDLPITGRESGIGRLGLNLNGGLSELSDFGTLTTLGAGLSWAPTTKLNFLASYTREDGAPTLQQLGDPQIDTAGVQFFDAVNGETVEITTRTGGNPNLGADRRTVWKLGANWQVLETPELRLRGEFVSQRIDNPQISFPALTPALEDAFEERFDRDPTTNRLIFADLRPVNAEQSRRDTIRWGFELSKELKSAAPSPAQIQALRQQFAARFQGQGASTPGSPPPGGPPSTPPSSGAPGERTPPAADGAERPRGGGGGFGGGGRGGGFFGGRNGGRLNVSMTHTVTLKDELDIGPGIPTLDYLDGEAASGTGGRPRHQVELQGGYYNNGLGARLSANWRSATRVDSAAGQDIRFGDFTTLDLRLFANLGERFDLVAKNPFFLGTSVRFEVKNLLNEKPDVRGANGVVPFAYQGDRLEPIGRTIGISFRKLFLPTRFRRPPGGGTR